MRMSTVNAARRLATITGERCARCPGVGPERCCADAFCEVVERGLRHTGRPVPERTGHPKARFLGPTGCVLPPELRPGCTGFVCGPWKQRDRAFRREVERLEARVFADPDVDALLEGMRDGTWDRVRPAALEAARAARRESC